MTFLVYHESIAEVCDLQTLANILARRLHAELCQYDSEQPLPDNCETLVHNLPFDLTLSELIDNTIEQCGGENVRVIQLRRPLLDIIWAEEARADASSDQEPDFGEVRRAAFERIEGVTAALAEKTCMVFSVDPYCNSEDLSDRLYAVAAAPYDLMLLFNWTAAAMAEAVPAKWERIATRASEIQYHLTDTLDRGVTPGFRLLALTDAKVVYVSLTALQYLWSVCLYCDACDRAYSELRIRSEYQTTRELCNQRRFSNGDMREYVRAHLRTGLKA